MKKFFIVTISLLIILIPISAYAATFKFNENALYVNKDETLDDDLYAASPNLIVEGEIKGDALLGAGTLNIDGNISGDLIAGAGTINLKGNVKDDVRIAAGTINIDGNIGSDLIAAGGTVTLGNQSQIKGDVILGAGNISIGGEIDGSLRINAGQVSISGVIEKDINIFDVEKLTVLSSAEIKGNLTYTSSNKAEISPDAKISGSVTQKQPKAKITTRKIVLAALVFSYLSALLVALVLIKLIPQSIVKVSQILEKHFLKSLFWGFVALILIPIFVILLFITMIGFPLGMITIILYGIALYLSKILVGIFVGKKVLEYVQKQGLASQKKEVSLYLAAVLGILLYVLVGIVPYLGFFVKLAVLLSGLGVIVVMAREHFSQAK